MSRVKVTLAVVSLSALYMFSLVYLIGLVADIHFPWQPVAGKPAYALLFATSISHALAVISAATIVAALVVRMFRNQSIRFGFLIAAPAALIHAWSAWQASEFVQLSSAAIAMAAKNTALAFFSKHGYVHVPTAEAPANIPGAAQLRSLCPSPASLMRKELR